MRIVFIHLYTEHVGQNERQKQHPMAIVTGTRVLGCFFLVLQLPESIAGAGEKLKNLFGSGPLDWTAAAGGNFNSSNSVARLSALTLLVASGLL